MELRFREALRDRVAELVRRGATTLRSGFLYRRAPASGRLLPRAAGLAGRRLGQPWSCEPWSCELWSSCGPRRSCEPTSCRPWSCGLHPSRRLAERWSSSACRRSCEPTSCEPTSSCGRRSCEPTSCELSSCELFGRGSSGCLAGRGVLPRRGAAALRACLFHRWAPAAAVVFFRAPPVLRAVVLRAAVLRVELVLRPSSCEPSWSCDCSSRARPTWLEPPDLLREDPEREVLLDERAEERAHRRNGDRTCCPQHPRRSTLRRWRSRPRVVGHFGAD